MQYRFYCSGLRGRFNAGGPQEEFPGHLLRFRRVCRRKKQVLTLRGQDFQKLAQLRHEAQVHHAVGLVQDEVRDLLCSECFPEVEFHESSRSGHHQVAARFEPLLLGFVADTAVHNLDAQVGPGRQAGGDIRNLQRQLLGRREDDAPGALSLGVGQHGHNGQQKGQCFPRSRLRDSDDILSGPDAGNGLALDFGGLGNAHVIQYIEVLPRDLQIGKRHAARLTHESSRAPFQFLAFLCRPDVDT